MLDPYTVGQVPSDINMQARCAAVTTAASSLVRRSGDLLDRRAENGGLTVEDFWKLWDDIVEDIKNNAGQAFYSALAYRVADWQWGFRGTVAVRACVDGVGSVYSTYQATKENNPGSCTHIPEFVAGGVVTGLAAVQASPWAKYITDSWLSHVPLSDIFGVAADAGDAVRECWTREDISVDDTTDRIGDQIETTLCARLFQIYAPSALTNFAQVLGVTPLGWTALLPLAGGALLTELYTQYRKRTRVRRLEALRNRPRNSSDSPAYSWI